MIRLRRMTSTKLALQYDFCRDPALYASGQMQYSLHTTYPQRHVPPGDNAQVHRHCTIESTERFGHKQGLWPANI